jgi:hypothetical protein
MTQATEEIDQLSAALIDEFLQHLKDYRLQNPEADERMVFEAWVIQKLAGIHHVLGDRPQPRPH